MSEYQIGDRVQLSNEAGQGDLIRQVGTVKAAVPIERARATFPEPKDRAFRWVEYSYTVEVEEQCELPHLGESDLEPA